MRHLTALTLVLLIVLSGEIIAQIPPRLISHFKVDYKFKDTLTFSNKWEYPWHILKNENGRFINIMDSLVHPEDTIKLYYTANCVSTHQGRHYIRYCSAIKSNDSIILNIKDKPPAYVSELTVKISGSSFESSFKAVYPVLDLNSEIFWRTKSQTLILDKQDYKIGDTIKGFIKVRFTEMNKLTRQQAKDQRTNYLIEGYFKTQLEDNKNSN
jgi:hypothetical protein